MKIFINWFFYEFIEKNFLTGIKHLKMFYHDFKTITSQSLFSINIIDSAIFLILSFVKNLFSAIYNFLKIILIIFIGSFSLIQILNFFI